MFDLTNLPPGFFDDPYPTYAALPPVAPQPDGSLVLSRHGDLDRIYRDTTTFISDKRAVFAPKFGRDAPLFEHHTTSLVFNDPPLHSRVRSVMVGALSPRALASMEPALRALVDRLLDGFDGDVIDGFAGAIPIEVIGNLLGIPHADRAPLRGWSLAILGALEPELTPAQLDAGNAAVTEFATYLRDLITERRAHPLDPDTDVLTRLIQSPEPLSEIELIQNCIFILNAGHETTTNLIANALNLLDREPEAKAQLIAQPDLIQTGVDEFLRLESPNQFGNRLVAQETKIAGQPVAKGTNLHLCMAAANRDPLVFPDPDRPDLTRRPNKHLAFAGGPHTCVGLTLARMEGRIAITRFLTRFPEYAITRATRSPRIRFRGFTALACDV